LATVLEQDVQVAIGAAGHRHAHEQRGNELSSATTPDPSS
jgi:hypothetical protein